MEQKAIQTSILSPLPTEPEEPFGIFAKYSNGSVSPFMPFKLCSDDGVSKPNCSEKKRNTRGPYRRYSLDEKKNIILRILRGETLKIISEETKIPKRNLIRWKHEYLVEEKFDLQSCASSNVQSSASSKEAKSGTTLETNQPSIKAEKNEH